jgi:hypothetical protein
MVVIQWIAVDAIKSNPRHARIHSNKQVCQITGSIAVYAFLAPILIDEGSVHALLRRGASA